MTTEQQTQQTDQSSQAAQGQSTSADGAATQGSSQGSTATSQGQTQQTQAAQGQAQAAPSKPDWLPENFFDPAAGPKWDEFGKHFSTVMTAQAAAESRRLTLPTKPEDVKLELPKDFKLPQGVDFKLDPSKPEFAKLQQLAVARGLDNETVTDLLGVYAETLVGSESEIQTARAAEIGKLGANGPARVTALQTFFNGLVGESKAKAIESMMATAGIVEALETVVAKFSSQGSASFSQAHREPGSGGKVTEEQWKGMSDAQRLDYVRSHSKAA